MAHQEDSPSLGWAVIDYLEAGGPVIFDGWDAAGEPVGRPGPLTDEQVTAIIQAFRVAA
jgi:hypothetical protein